ncbi:T-cell ecto-ADP-ribosyltransferase 1-like [Poeciliopsis prolifica]|uniref:T-cell ecto-ADP-ribosyltransferase 1-like n=1 Tax=Poeciliopsis prolifica TaxID=188132 RepID=UPI002413C18C|nr:T-cell ecto-ADP-ribosyltransferase 1-like [Poeciliopsis prolifica]
MLGRGTLLLDTLLFSFFYSQVSLGDVKLLDSTSPVIDDRYDGCRKEAMEKFTPDLLKEELGKSEKLQKAWRTWEEWRARSNCTSQIPGGTEDHTSALSVYHFGDAEFLEELNNAVETMMVNVTTYEKDFHFKALHFLLMDSMMLLKPKECREVYATLKAGEKVPEINSKVRLASFTAVDSDLSFTDLYDITIFKIKTCFYVNLDDQLCLRNLGETLLSPAEVFTVKSINKKSADDEEYTEVVLSQSSLESNHNCIIFSRSAAEISTLSFLSVLLFVTLFLMYL